MCTCKWNTAITKFKSVHQLGWKGIEIVQNGVLWTARLPQGETSLENYLAANMKIWLRFGTKWPESRMRSNREQLPSSRTQEGNGNITILRFQNCYGPVISTFFLFPLLSFALVFILAMLDPPPAIVSWLCL